MKPRKSSPVKVRGPWFAMPLDLIRSHAFASLSPHGAKLFIDMCAQLGRNSANNGDLCAPLSLMARRGWTSNATLNAAIQELLDAGLLIVTRMGDRKRCRLYALTMWPLECDLAKLDVRPGCYLTYDWEARGTPTPPTEQNQARWKRVRKN